MCHYHQHACLLLWLSLLSACLSDKLQWMIQVTREIQGTSWIWEFWRCYNLNPIQDGHFRGCSLMGGAFCLLPPCLKSATHILQWWNLAQLYLTLWRSKKCINHVTHPLSSAGISIFWPEIRKFCYIKKYTYRLEFNR